MHATAFKAIELKHHKGIKGRDIDLIVMQIKRESNNKAEIKVEDTRKSREKKTLSDNVTDIHIIQEFLISKNPLRKCRYFMQVLSSGVLLGCWKYS